MTKKEPISPAGGQVRRVPELTKIANSVNSEPSECLLRNIGTWASLVNSQRGGCGKGANDVQRDGHAPNREVEVSDATAVSHLSPPFFWPFSGRFPRPSVSWRSAHPSSFVTGPVADFRARADDMDAGANRRHAAAAQRAHALASQRSQRAVAGGRGHRGRSLAARRWRWPPAARQRLARRTPPTPRSPALTGRSGSSRKTPITFWRAGFSISSCASRIAPFAISIRRSRSIREMARRSSIGARAQTQAHHDNAIALYGVRQYDRAIRELDRAINVSPDHAACVQPEGLVPTRPSARPGARSRTSTRRSDWTAISRKAFVNRGNIFQSANTWERALADYSEAAGLKPQDAYSLYSRGLVMRALGREAEAARRYRQGQGDRAGHRA